MEPRAKRSVFGRVFVRKGRPGYYIRIRRRGIESERWAGPDRRTATEFLHATLRKVSRDELLGDRHVPAMTIKTLGTSWLAARTGKHAESTGRGDEARVHRVLEHFAARYARDVSAGDIGDFLDGIGVHGATRNRYLSVLSGLFKHGLERGVVHENPVAGIARAREERKAVPFLTSKDVAAIVGQPWDARERAMLRVLADAGLRRSEAARLTWEDADLDRRVLVVGKSKSKRPREVPMTAAVHKALSGLREPKCTGLIWPEYPDKQALDRLSKRFGVYAKRAGARVSLHGLRHGFCSRLAQAGVPLPTIAALAGHESIATTSRYASHLPGGATFDAIRRLEGGLRGGQAKGRKRKRARRGA